MLKHKNVKTLGLQMIAFGGPGRVREVDGELVR